MESRRLRKKANKKKKILIFITGVVVLIAILTTGVVKLTSRPDFCRTCHEMKPEYMTWQFSNHKNISCVKCHIEPGISKLVIHKISSVKEIYLHFTNNYSKPIQMEDPLTSKVCLNCHQGNIKPRVSNLIFSHQNHINERIACVACHAGTAHGKVAERGKNDEAAYDSWETVTAEKEMISENTNPTMKQCISCHKVRKVPAECKTCHLNISKPASHQIPEWRVNHGKLARQDLNICEKCHQNSLQANDANSDLDVVTYARTTEFCYKCHVENPPSHLEPGWQMGHGSKATISKSDCLVCHRDRFGDKEPNENVATANCADCH